jgi:hypothetical protein
MLQFDLYLRRVFGRVVPDVSKDRTAAQDSLTLKMNATWPLETSASIRPRTRRHIPEDITLQQHRYDNLWSRMKWSRSTNTEAHTQGMLTKHDTLVGRFWCVACWAVQGFKLYVTVCSGTVLLAVCERLRVKILELVTRWQMGRKRTIEEYPPSARCGLTSTWHVSFYYTGCNNIHRLATTLVYGLLYTNNTGK